MTIQELEKEVMDVIARSTETEIKVTPDVKLYEDMGISSIEAMVLLEDLEDTFGIDIQVSKLRNVRTAGDICRIVVLALQD